MKFINQKIDSIRRWFAEPASPADRLLSAVIGTWAGVWIGGLGRVFYETPVSFMSVGKFALGGAITCMLVGAVFPKYSRIAFYPFAFIGFGST